jgi:hypothetical protein
MYKAKLLARILIGLVLGAASVGLINVCETKLPYSRALAGITDALLVPAVLIAQIVYPEGVHTGIGASHWGIVFLCSGVLFYGVVWFVVLSVITRKRVPGEWPKS